MSSKFTPERPIAPNHVKHRETARVFLTSADGRMLLIYTHWDPGTGLPPRWLTPGGGIDPGESALEAAVRELREETGLQVGPEALGEKVHELYFELNWADGQLETGVAHFYRLQVDEIFDLDKSEWMPDEHRDIIEYRWWNPADLIASEELVGPPGLREYLQHHFLK